MNLLRRKSRGSVTEFLQEQDGIHSVPGWGLTALNEHRLHCDIHCGAEYFSEAVLHVQKGQKQTLFNSSLLIFRMCALKYIGSNFKVQKKKEKKSSHKAGEKAKRREKY